MQMFLLIVVNAVVGFIVGACGISGFLLPMYYAVATDFAVGEYLALSYWAFILSGVLAMVGCKDGIDREKRTLGWLCAGSAIGAIFGVKLNSFISPQNVKLILYIVVLLAGFSILYTGMRKSERSGQRSALLDSKPFMLVFGILTGTICAIGGSGGPILVMPLLAAMGMEVHSSMAVGLLDSLFLSVPAFAGYVRGIEIKGLFIYMGVIFFAYGGAVFSGRKLSSRVPSEPLKKAVGIFSIIISIYMLYSVFW
ncbi:hypothetical protein IMSAG049_00640 [Clostridiales bacterium]|nr:hypothetical protein IMSAG049_00640 [Clostridiales bacterium]